MSKTATLPVQTREPGEPRRIRREGFIPAVLYGNKVPNIALMIDRIELTRLLAADGHRGLLHLQFEGDDLPDGDATRTVMIRDMQRDPLSRKVVHLDFYQVDLKEKITTEIPVRVLGEEVAAKGEGVVQYNLRSVLVQCLPTDIPDYLEIDISELEIGDSVYVGDLSTPDTVEILTEPEETIVTIVIPTMEIEEEPEEEELTEEELEALELEGEMDEDAEMDEDEEEEKD